MTMKIVWAMIMRSSRHSEQFFSLTAINAKVLQFWELQFLGIAILGFAILRNCNSRYRHLLQFQLIGVWVQ
jgi:hypothetical protein